MEGEREPTDRATSGEARWGLKRVQRSNANGAFTTLRQAAER